MKPFTIASLFLIICLIGCESHFYRIKDNSLHIYLKKPEAHSVSFAYSEDGYSLHQTEKIDSKTWVVKVPLESEFTYFFIIDGATYVPPCRLKEKDDFGSENCIFIPEM